MAFFRNTSVNLLNLHYTIHALAMMGGGAFFSAWLLKSGVSVPMVFVSLALIVLGRFLVRPLAVPLVLRFGLRRMLMTGTVAAAIPYLIIPEVQGFGVAIIALIVVGAVSDAIYWSTYHAYFSMMGDDEHRGHQLGAREALTLLTGIVSPLLTGWLLVTYGPRIAFWVNAVMAAASALPLAWTPEAPVKASVKDAYRSAWLGVKLFAADGFTAIGHFTWQIALFVTLHEDPMAYGGAMAIAALVGAAAGFVVGRHMDGHRRRQALVVVYLMLAAMTVLRALAVGHPALAVTLNAIGAISGCLYPLVFMTAIYLLSKNAPCTLRFHVATEGGWDAGAALGLLLAALLLWADAPLNAGLWLSLLGLAASFIMLWRYYATTRPGSDQ
jgi:MFS family permease